MLPEGNSSDFYMSLGMFNMGQLSEDVVFLVMAICALDVLLNAICLPVSALNFSMIAQTALLHRNLKFLLLLQSSCITLFSVCEIVRIVPKLAHFDAFYGDAITITVLKASLVWMIFIDWLGFGLLCERTLATIKCRTYEADRRSYFSIICFIFLCLATATSYYLSVDLKEPGGVRMDPMFPVEIYTFLTLSFICMLVFFYLLKYNKQLYSKMAFVHNTNRRQDLSMKYQISENIRTSRQLLLSGVFHFLDVFLTIGISLAGYYGLMNRSAVWNSLLNNSIFLFYAASNLGIQISVITMHPMLKRRLRRMSIAVKMAHVWKSRVGPASDESVPNGPIANCALDDGAEEFGHGQHVPLNIFGNNLLNQNTDIGEYFRVLDTFWNKPMPAGVEQQKSRRK